MSVLALIPARGGSKGVPGKNLKKIGGRTLIARAVEAAQKSGVCDHVLVSTEYAAIAEEARRAGAEVPFLRPASLAEDETAMPPVIAHAIETYEEHIGREIETLVFLEATVPFRRPEHISAAVARWFVEQQLVVAPVGFVEMDAHESVNIDSEIDLMLAELIAARYGI